VLDIRATDAANCKTTSDFLRNAPLPDFLILPFKTETGLKDERMKAGYDPDKIVPPSQRAIKTLTKLISNNPSNDKLREAN